MTEDDLSIFRLMDLYGHILDERQFSRGDELFTPDAIYDVSDFGMGVVVGLGAIVDLWRRSARHPLAHHATNVVITGKTLERARVVSHGIGVRPNGLAGSVTYCDLVVKTPAGWRIAERVATLRRPA